MRITRMSHQRKLPHIVPLLQAENKPQKAGDVHAEGKEAVVRNQRSQEILHPDEEKGD